MAKIQTKFCPFCGCGPTKVLYSDTDDTISGRKKGWQVECVNCGARGPCGFSTEKDAILAYNHGDPPYRRLDVAIMESTSIDIDKEPPYRLITTYELTDQTTLDDLLLCLAATIEDSLLKAGATPIKDYSIIDLFEYAKPFCLSIYNDKKKNIAHTVGWPS